MVSNTLPEHESNTSLHDMEKKQLADQLGDIHYKILPIKKLLICLFSLSLALFLSFVDQTSVTIALATIQSIGLPRHHYWQIVYVKYYLEDYLIFSAGKSC